MWLPVNGVGAIDPADVGRAIRARPGQRGLVSLMYVNNEIGTIHDLPAIATVIRQSVGGESESGQPPRVSLHTDAVQAPGHVPLDVRAMGVDFLSLGAHKFHGPPGVGLLFCRDPTALPPRKASFGLVGKRNLTWLRPLFFGGHQQGSLRPDRKFFFTEKEKVAKTSVNGTESVALIRAMGAALEDVCTHLSERLDRYRIMTARIWETLIPFIVTIGHRM